MVAALAAAATAASPAVLALALALAVAAAVHMPRATVTRLPRAVSTTMMEVCLTQGETVTADPVVGVAEQEASMRHTAAAVAAAAAAAVTASMSVHEAQCYHLPALEP